MQLALEISKVGYKYPNSEEAALSDLNFSIKKGESFGFLGPNGAGKTTLLSCICKQMTDFSGEIKIFSKDLRNLGEEILKIGFAPQELALYPSLTAYENLDFFSRLSGVSGKKSTEQIKWSLESTGLYERRFQKVEEYSGGMKRRLNLAIAILNRPSLLILDEPTVGVDPQTRNHIFEQVEKLKKENITIIYTTHYMEEVERLCENVGVISSGKLLFVGSLSDLKKQEGFTKLEDCYLSLTGQKHRDAEVTS